MKSDRLRRGLLMLALVGASFLSVRCATVINGTSQSVAVESDPMQASVVITQSPGGKVVFEGNTPAHCRLSRSNEYDVVVSMAGHREETAHISKSFSPIFLVNILLGGIPGMIVDLITGAVNDLTPRTVHVSLMRASLDSTDPRRVAVVRVTGDGAPTSVATVSLARP